MAGDGSSRFRSPGWMTDDGDTTWCAIHNVAEHRVCADRIKLMAKPVTNRGNHAPQVAPATRGPAIPSDPELAEIGRRVLMEIATDRRNNDNARVRAAAVLIGIKGQAADETPPKGRLSPADIKELEALAGEPEMVGEVVPTERGNSGAIEPEPVANGPELAAKE